MPPLSNGGTTDRSPAAGGKAERPNRRQFSVVVVRCLGAAQDPRITWMGAASSRRRARAKLFCAGGGKNRCRSNRSLESLRLRHPAQGRLASRMDTPNPAAIPPPLRGTATLRQPTAAKERHLSLMRI